MASPRKKHKVTSGAFRYRALAPRASRCNSLAARNRNAAERCIQRAVRVFLNVSSKHFPGYDETIRTLERIGYYRKASRLSQAAQIAEWRAVVRLRSLRRKQLTRIVNGLFRDQQRAVFAAIDQNFKAQKIDFTELFDLDGWTIEFTRRAGDIVLRILEDGEQSGLARVAASADTVSTRPVDDKILVDQVLRSKIVNEETGEQIIAILRDAIERNQDNEYMKREVRKLFRGYRAFRTNRIVQTTITGAFESGTLNAWIEAGIERKRWLSAQDPPRVRPEHLAASGQTVDVQDAFVVGGDLLRFPGDPQGSAGMVINCRCTMIPEV